MPENEDMTITSQNIRLILGGHGWKIDDLPDHVVLNMLSQHLREYAAMENAVWQVLRFAQTYGH